eukprot:scaffold655342_cov46-Prasinocladus_malaysianus.AAC.1
MELYKKQLMSPVAVFQVSISFAWFFGCWMSTGSTRPSLWSAFSCLRCAVQACIRHAGKCDVSLNVGRAGGLTPIV